MKITKRQLKRIIKKTILEAGNPNETRTDPKTGLTYRSRTPVWRVDIEDPAMMADDFGMDHAEYIQMYVDVVNQMDPSLIKIVKNTPEVLTVEGGEDALLDFGWRVNQAEGGPSFNEQEYREYAMYRA
tara:strand:- start:273 stop:656 length:384 start_codon:yes stop_codon:yes gene_type:complete